MKSKACAEVGIQFRHIQLPTSTTEAELLSTLRGLNRDSAVHAVLLQLPLDSEHTIDAEKCTDTIAVEKDVDGLTATNAGKLARGS